METTRGIVRHAVQMSRDEVMRGHVSMLSGVQGLQAQQIRGWTICGNRTFAIPVYRRHVVVYRADGGFRQRPYSAHLIVLPDGGCELQIVDCKSALRVVPRD